MVILGTRQHCYVQKDVVEAFFTENLLFICVIQPSIDEHFAQIALKYNRTKILLYSQATHEQTRRQMPKNTRLRSSKNQTRSLDVGRAFLATALCAMRWRMKLNPPDILECLRVQLGCEYISQLPAAPYGKNAVKELAHLDLKRYSLSEWANAIYYLTSKRVEFWSYDEVAQLITHYQQSGHL